MTVGIAVEGLDAAGGTQLAGGQSWFFVQDHLVVVLGDSVAAHGGPPHSPPPSMVSASSWMTIDGIPVCRAGDSASCGHGSSGRNWFLIT